MLGTRVLDAVVADLYAGSGALGIEALSRGAERAVFVEKAGHGAVAIRANLAALGLEDRATVVQGDVRGHLAGSAPVESWTLVLLDPPYGSPDLRPVLEQLDQRLPASASVVVEHGRADALPELERLRVDRQRRYGDTSVTILTGQ